MRNLATRDDGLDAHRALTAALVAVGLRATLEYPGYIHIPVGGWVWVGDVERDGESPACWRFQRQSRDLSTCGPTFAIDADRTTARIVEGVLAHVRESIGEALLAVPFEDNRTAEDAIARLNLARVGSLVTPGGASLTGANLTYLQALRQESYRFLAEIEREIARVSPQNGGDRG